MATSERATDVRMVPVSRETANVLHEVQSFLIKLEQAMLDTADGEMGLVEPWSSWADRVGSVIAGWQTQKLELAVQDEPPSPTFRYLIFLNESRTHMLQAWPNSDYSEWSLHESHRDDPGEVWRPPFQSRFIGDSEKVRREALSRRLTVVEEVPWPSPVRDGDGYSLGDPKLQAFEPGGSSLR